LNFRNLEVEFAEQPVEMRDLADDETEEDFWVVVQFGYHYNQFAMFGPVDVSPGLEEPAHTVIFAGSIAVGIAGAFEMAGGCIARIAMALV
jgi:hypothetical protein